MSSLELKLGADPEFFLFDKKLRVNTSAHNLLPGTKAAPHRLTHGAVQVDGTAVEFNIDPASSPADFNNNIRSVLTEIRAMVPDRYAFKYTPVIQYGYDRWNTLVPLEAKTLGCDPDYNAWLNGAPNPTPTLPTGRRTGSGHLHIGFTQNADITDPNHLADCMAVVRRLDKFFSMLAPSWETRDSALRRQYYGNWGAFRPKPYGVEYRVLDNTWLKRPTIWPSLFTVTTKIVDDLYTGRVHDRDIDSRLSTLRRYNTKGPLPLPSRNIELLAQNHEAMTAFNLRSDFSVYSSFDSLARSERPFVE